MIYEGKKGNKWGATTSGPKRAHPKACTPKEATEALIRFIAPKEGTEESKHSTLLCALRESKVCNKGLFISVYAATLEDLAVFFCSLACDTRVALKAFFHSNGLVELASYNDTKKLGEAAEKVFFSCKALSSLFSQEEFRTAFFPGEFRALTSDATAQELFMAEVLQKLFWSDKAEALFSARYGRWEGFPKRRTHGTFGAELKKSFRCTSDAEREDAKAAIVLAAANRKFFADYPNFDLKTVLCAILENSEWIKQKA